METAPYIHNIYLPHAIMLINIHIPYLAAVLEIIQVSSLLPINYYLDQAGFSPNGWLFNNPYIADAYFIDIVKPKNNLRNYFWRKN